MRPAVVLLTVLVWVAAAAAGALDLVHQQREIRALQHRPAVNVTQMKLLVQDEASDALDLAKLRAQFAGYTRALAVPAPDAMTQRLDDLSRDFTDFCNELSQHVGLDLEIDLETSCPASAP
jgi:hypothetical protein